MINKRIILLASLTMLCSEISSNDSFDYSSRDDVKEYIDPDWESKVLSKANLYRDIFGKENFLIEIQCIDEENSPAAKLVAQGLRYVAKKYKIPSVATADSHYPTKADATDHLILLCSALFCSDSILILSLGLSLILIPILILILILMLILILKRTLTTFNYQML
mgnify:CR=1 FL=1